jgi:two-component system chemotaxis response regulator CheY
MQLNKILIVEDSELLHRMYDLVLLRYRREGTTILHSYNGKEALSTLSQHPDAALIILDINMPVMSGLEFLSFCKDQRVFQDIPVILVSTEGKEDDTRRGLQAGARAYVTKPFQPSDLHKVIEKLIGAPDPSAAAGSRRLGVTGA